MVGKRFPMRQRAWLLLWAAPLVAIVLLAIAFAQAMGHKAERLAGSNSVVLERPILQISGGSLLCQTTLAPRDATAVQLFVAPAGPKGPPLGVEITAGSGRALASGHLAGGWSGGVVKVPIARIRESAADGKICIRNEGKDPLAFAGVSSKFVKAEVDSRPQNAALALLFFRPGTESWSSLLPTIAHRAGVLKGSLAGAWVFWFAIALVALAGALSMAITFRGREA